MKAQTNEQGSARPNALTVAAAAGALGVAAGFAVLHGVASPSSERPDIQPVVPGHTFTPNTIHPHLNHISDGNMVTPAPSEKTTTASPKSTPKSTSSPKVRPHLNHVSDQNMVKPPSGEVTPPLHHIDDSGMVSPSPSPTSSESPTATPTASPTVG